MKIGLLVVLGLLVMAFLGGCVVMQLPRFGAEPSAKMQQVYQSSANFTDGEFHNQIETPVLKEGLSTWSVIRSNMTTKVENLQPDGEIPVFELDFTRLDPNQDVIVWLGHSGYFLQLQGKRILVDPVFSDYAAPFSFAVKAFAGSTPFRAEDFPDIDLLLISHDHWDHLDHDSILALQSKVKQVFVPLGVSAHFQRWDYPSDKVTEADWFETISLSEALKVHLVPARHYSGRGLTKNKTLWGGFVFENAEQRILLSGDSGYGPHFAEIAKRFDSFDLVALDMGQYDERWPYIHMTPTEAVEVAKQLNTKALLPAHVGRFSLARHPWFEPFNQVQNLSQGQSFQLLTPLIGEPMALDNLPKHFRFWWQDVDAAQD